jgi:Fe-S-cluster-containing dehydrogenase component
MMLQTIAPPAFHPELCASSRFGIKGCQACADVCPHQALQFGSAGPAIDGDLCQRCGACTAACPVGALERSFLPDDQLWKKVEAAVASRPRRLVIACHHNPDHSELEQHGDSMVLRLPCVQLVSDDLVLFAITAGVDQVEVRAEETCQHLPHIGPKRAVEVACTTVAALGLGANRVVYREPGCQPHEGDSDGNAAHHDAPLESPILSIVAAANRVRRRVGLLEHLASFATQKATPIQCEVPWQQVQLDQDKCTMCGSCAFACPTGALRVGREGGALLGMESLCIGCHLCENTCPEQAITLQPIVPDQFQIRTLMEQPLAHCLKCRKPIGPEAALVRVEEILKRTGNGDHSVLRLCDECKDVRVFQRAQRSAMPAESKAADPDKQIDSSPAGKRTISLPVVSGSSGTSPAKDEVTSRRGFLAKALAVGGATAAMFSGCSGTPAPAGDEAKHRYGMVIDTQRCVGCKACVLACKTENKTPPGVNYILVTENSFGPRPDDKPIFTAKPCFHCEHPPCVDVCPVSATFKRKQDGIVVMDYDRCIGCRYCQTACPYAARYFDFGEHYVAAVGDTPYDQMVPSPEYGQFRQRAEGLSPVDNVRKCMFCMHLQDENGEYDKAARRWPACAKTCTGHAIHFGDLNDPESDAARLIRERQTVRAKEELGAEPNVHYLL